MESYCLLKFLFMDSYSLLKSYYLWTAIAPQELLFIESYCLLKRVLIYGELLHLKVIIYGQL